MRPRVLLLVADRATGGKPPGKTVCGRGHRIRYRRGRVPQQNRASPGTPGIGQPAQSFLPRIFSFNSAPSEVVAMEPVLA